MNKYLTELVNLPYHMFNSTLTEEEPATDTYLGGNHEVERGLLVTFYKKDS